MASSRITGTNENISTYGTLGMGRDYDALTDWEQFTDVDLVTATTSEVLECYADSASYDDRVTVSGATTSTSYFRIIRAADGEAHGGDPASGVKFDSTTNFDLILIGEDNFSVQDLVLTLTINSANGRSCIIDTAATTTGTTVIGCIIDTPNNAGANTAEGLQAQGVSMTVVNCLAINAESGGFRCLNAATTLRLYNCTSDGNVTPAIIRTNGTLIAKNCLGLLGSAAAFSGTFDAGSVTNAADDTSAPGTGSYSNQVFTFTDRANKDYSLHRNDLGAKFRGTDLSADATFPFNDDITGATITYWSIGAFNEATQQSSRRTGDNENVSTYAASGADYDALTDWEQFTDTDLVTGAVTEVLECEAGTYDDTVSLAGATTDGRYFRIIRPAAGHEHGGLPGSGVEFSATVLTSNAVLHVSEAFASIQGIAVSTTASNASTNFGILLVTDYNTIVGCLATVGNAGAGGGNGFSHATGSDRSRIANCLGLSCKTAGFAANGTSVDIVWTNNTSVGSPTGFVKGASASVIAINNLADDNATAGYSGTYATGTSHNASAAADAPGTNDRDSQTFTFINALGSNYHLDATDEGALGFGNDMSASPWFNYTDDVDSEEVVDWSIGFDSDPEAVGGPTPGHSFQHQGHDVGISGYKRSWSV